MQTSSLTFIIAFVVVLALIGLAAFLVRRFGGSRLGSNANRGRMPRLAVIDAAAVDNRRRLVLVRRDNVEHLLMIGGPSDIVVEQNIVRASPGRGEQMTPRSSVGGELPRSAPLPDAAGWTDGDSRADAFEPIEPDPAPAPRPNRPTFADEIRRPAPPLGDRREPAPSPSPRPMMPSPMIRPEPAIDTPPARSEPMMPRPTRSEPARSERPAEPPRMPPPPPQRAAAPQPAPPVSPPGAPSNAEQNLAEMAQRLEAALRRPGGDASTAPPVAPEQPRAAVPRTEASTAPAVTPPAKSGFENLEDEMASLLGRPKSPS